MTRAYEQKARADSAAETRRRILDGVYECLREEPSTPPSVGEIARRAGVARSTVYLVFGSRAGLFDAFAQELWQRSGLPNLQEAVNVPDAREGVLGGIRAGVAIFAADRDVFNALFAMTKLDADAIGGAVDRIEGRRAEGMAWGSRRLAQPEAAEARRIGERGPRTSSGWWRASTPSTCSTPGAGSRRARRAGSWRTPSRMRSARSPRVDDPRGPSAARIACD